jgi:hypothetical protein
MYFLSFVYFVWSDTAVFCACWCLPLTEKENKRELEQTENSDVTVTHHHIAPAHLELHVLDVSLRYSWSIICRPQFHVVARRGAVGIIENLE